MNYLTCIQELIKVAYLLGQSGPSFVHWGSVSLVHRVDIAVCAMHQYRSHVEKSGLSRQTQWHCLQSRNPWTVDKEVVNCFIVKVVEVKCTLVQALRLCTGRTAHRRIRGIALFFLDHDTRRGWGVSVTIRPFFTPGKDTVLIVEEAGCAQGPVWTGAENLALHWDSIPWPYSP